ncbi:GNAT family N-acetyltransferase [Agarivorans sp. 1_MG-2023]|uniref:GNAT family N-acetyltransferase n=1 Tax=Agarivorans sp. 1_MG-2023 TaxID=3062634 RepID=UPI0026E13088|nr:N-acetyltransferase [Agarivorans sp. 1_MG-2023]MDO6762246.1 N-acetyltransferase [Agarivorans sp. 1_MG-2023]
MLFELFSANQSPAVIQLFTEVFSDSEGKEEGQLIGHLVTDIVANTKAEDLIGFVTLEDKEIVASIFFSRLVLPNKQAGYILSPVAVATRQQGKGVGQKLINAGIKHLRALGGEVLVTYGDPSFYSKVGFSQISQDMIKAPLVLSHPEGWLAQSLSETPLAPIIGETACIEALNHQKYW